MEWSGKASEEMFAQSPGEGQNSLEPRGFRAEATASSAPEAEQEGGQVAAVGDGREPAGLLQGAEIHSNPPPPRKEENEGVRRA